MRFLSPALPFALGLVAAGAAQAEGIAVAIDHSTRLNVRGAAANIVLGNPAVADVSVLDSHTLYVSGRAYGSTDLVITDTLGRTLYSGEVAVIRPVSDVTVYRGAARTDFSCTTSCAATDRTQPNGAAKPDLSSSGGVSGISAPAKP